MGATDGLSRHRPHAIKHNSRGRWMQLQQPSPDEPWRQVWKRDFGGKTDSYSLKLTIWNLDIGNLPRDNLGPGKVCQ